MSANQSAKSHTAFDPWTHLILAPIFVVTLGLAIYHYSHPGLHARALDFWLIVVAMSLFLLNVKTRVYSLRIQDRVIRLEERLRLAALLPSAELARAQSLTTAQLIALRFASDAELPGLVSHTLEGHLDPKQIKQSILSWRPDLARI